MRRQEISARVAKGLSASRVSRATDGHQSGGRRSSSVLEVSRGRMESVHESPCAVDDVCGNGGSAGTVECVTDMLK